MIVLLRTCVLHGRYAYCPTEKDGQPSTQDSRATDTTHDSFWTQSAVSSTSSSPTEAETVYSSMISQDQKHDRDTIITIIDDSDSDSSSLPMKSKLNRASNVATFSEYTCR